MNYIQYCQSLRPGDRIIVPINRWFSHHAIFWGWDTEGQGWIIENNKKVGVRFVTIEEFFFGFNYVETLAFIGSEHERTQAMERATFAVGSAYNIATWNCEQFANFVQFNKVKSQQVTNTALVVATALWFGGRL